MLNVATRWKMRSLRGSFVKWLAHSKKGQMDEKYDKMSGLVTDLWFKQRVFLSLRQACMEQRIENHVGKFKHWKSECERKRKEKYLDKK